MASVRADFQIACGSAGGNYLYPSTSKGGMRTCFSTILLLLLAGVARAALPTTQPIMATSDPVRENGIEFQAVAQAHWPVPAAGEKSDIQTGLKVTNRTERVVKVNLFDTVRIVLKDSAGRSLPLLGGRDRTTYPDPLVLAAGESKTIARNAALEWLKAGDGLRLIGQDGTGGVWYFDGLKPGNYTLSFEYENSEQMVQNLPNRPAPHAIDLKAGPYWFGKAKTKEAAVEIVEAGKGALTGADWQVVLKKKDDKVAITADGGKAIFSITSPSGIGAATIERKGERSPQTVVVRLHLRGLEFFAVSSGKVKVSAASDGKTAREHLWPESREGPALDKNSPYWMGIRGFDGSGKPANAAPIQDGWFEITLPKAILDQGKSLKLEWIDFYRG
jgi:hypothetical protein